ncbi:MAG: MerR family transcriptional regulator [Polaromonas sp.]
MLSLEDAAERYRNTFHNFKLICIAPAALPVYLVTADVLVGDKRPIPTIAEFILRAIKVGFSLESEIADFLGLEPASLCAVAREMEEERFLYRDGDNRLLILNRGEQVLAEMGEWITYEQTVSFIFDGIMRRPIVLQGADLVRPHELQVESTIEIGAIPNRKPIESELRLYELVAVLKSQRSELGDHFNILGIKRIVRATRMCRVVAGLLFRLTKGDELRIGFVADGDRAEDIERAFTEKGGLTKQAIIAGAGDHALESRLKRQLGAYIKNLAQTIRIEDLQSQVARARLGLHLAESNREANPGQDAGARLKAASDTLAEAEKALFANDARPAAPYELARLVESAMENSIKRLMISSNHLSRSIVDASWLKSVERAIDRGVDVTIVLIERRPSDLRGQNPRFDPYAELEKLRKRSKGKLRVLQGNKSEFFFVICDYKFALIVNSPFLSFRDKRRVFRPFAGMVLQTAVLVEAFASSISDKVKDFS